jgi:hypothetical protein
MILHSFFQTIGEKGLLGRIMLGSQSQFAVENNIQRA